MGRGAWRATVHGGHKELDTTEQARTLISFFDTIPEIFCFTSLIKKKMNSAFDLALNVLLIPPQKIREMFSGFRHC